MGRKKKFRPIITRIKLNPEQAVLSCCNSTVKLKQTVNNQCHPAACGAGPNSGNLS